MIYKKKAPLNFKFNGAKIRDIYQKDFVRNALEINICYIASFFLLLVSIFLFRHAILSSDVWPYIRKE